MRKLLLSLSFAFTVLRNLGVGGLLILSTFAFSQQYGWQDVSANVPGDSLWHDLSDVFFVSDNEGWITSSSHQEIYHTTDGGETFEIQTTSLGATSAIQMLDGNNGYSGGAGGWVYTTSDGGLNWNMLASMSSISDISFPFNSDTNNPIGYACGDAGRVWEITSTLTDLNSPSASAFGGISAPSVNNVWVCGGGRIYYYNGTDFTSQSTPGGTFNDIHFINDQEGWVVGNSGVIGHTTDGGSSWNRQANPAETQALALYSVFFLDSDKGWAVGNGGIILQTIDGGTTWTIEGEGLTTVFLNGVHFTSPTNGYVVGNGKTLLKYGELTGLSDGAETIAFEIFPNPVKDKFIVQSQKFKVEDAHIEIYDLNGRKLLEKQISAGTGEIEIDVSHLKSGVYFCKLITEKANATKKLMIQK